MSLATTDLSDAHPEAAALAPIFRDFGGVTGFHGQVVTLKVFEDNALVRSTLESPGESRVLVVDGGGSLRCALVGGLLALLVSPWFALLPVLAGINQWLYVLVGTCPASLILSRVTSLSSATEAGR